MPFDPVVTQATASSYYARRVALADAARARAQAGFAIAAAFITGLVAAGFVIDIAVESVTIRALGAAVVSLWALTAWLYMHTVAAPTSELPLGRYEPSAEAFVEAVLRSTETELAVIERRQGRSRLSALLAFTATVTLMLVVSLSDSASNFANAELYLRPAGREAIGRICQTPIPRTIHVRLDEATLNESFLRLDLATESCPGSGSEVLLPRSGVAVAHIVPD